MWAKRRYSLGLLVAFVLSTLVIVLSFPCRRTPAGQVGEKFESIPFTIPFSEDNENLLSELKVELRDKKIVVLGESLHEDGTTMLIKTELVHFLHDSLGFNLLLFEAGTRDCYKLDSLLSNGVEESPSRYLWSFWTMSWQSRPLWKYIQSSQTSGNPLHIGGIDCQYSGSTSDSIRFNEILDLSNIDYTTAKLRYPQFTSLRNHLSSVLYSDSFSLDKKSMDDLDNELAELESRIHSGNWCEEYISGMLNVLEYSQKYKKSDPKRIAWRDSLMFDNFKKHLNKRPEDKIILWCANMHAARGFWNGAKRPICNLGRRIADNYGGELYTILFDNYSRHSSQCPADEYYIGKNYSLESWLHERLERDNFYYISDLKPLGSQMVSRVFERECMIRLCDYSDAIIFVDSMENNRYDE